MEILYSWALKVQFYYLFYIVKHLITQDMRSFFQILLYELFVCARWFR